MPFAGYNSSRSSQTFIMKKSHAQSEKQDGKETAGQREAVTAPYKQIDAESPEQLIHMLQEPRLRQILSRRRDIRLKSLQDRIDEIRRSGSLTPEQRELLFMIEAHPRAGAYADLLK